MVKLKNSRHIEMCFAVALSQTYLEVLRFLAYPTSIGSHPERVSLYTAVYCVLRRRQRACWVEYIHSELLEKLVRLQEAS